MSMSTLRSSGRPRRHGVLVEPADRRALERAGWRTTLDYRENHVRARDGRLLEVVPTWTAEVERYDGDLDRRLGGRRHASRRPGPCLRDDVEAHRAHASTSRVRLLLPVRLAP